MKEQGRAPGPGASIRNIEAQSTIADLERQLAEAQGKVDAVEELREVIQRKNLTAWQIGLRLARILKEEK